MSRVLNPREDSLEEEWDSYEMTKTIGKLIESSLENKSFQSQNEGFPEIKNSKGKQKVIAKVVNKERDFLNLTLLANSSWLNSHQKGLCVVQKHCFKGCD